MEIFVSHYSREAPLALCLKEWIKSTFSGMCRLFVSNDIDNIPAGIKWLERISDELDKADVFLVLCSPDSITRPWINFETGCAWIKDVPVIPICHSGLSVANLPRPLSEFQSLQIESDDFISKLLKSIAKYLEISKIPRIDVNSLRTEINKALKEVEDSTFETLTINVPKGTYASLDESSISILKLFGDASDQSGSIPQHSRKLGLSEIRTQVYYDELVKFGFISKSETVASGSPTRYHLTEEGRKWLFSKRLV